MPVVATRLRDNDFVETTAVQGALDNQLQGFMFHPRGSLLRLDPNAAVASDYLRVEEEEAPLQLRARFKRPSLVVDWPQQDNRARRRQQRTEVR